MGKAEPYEVFLDAPFDGPTSTPSARPGDRATARPLDGRTARPPDNPTARLMARLRPPATPIKGVAADGPRAWSEQCSNPSGPSASKVTA